MKRTVQPYLILLCAMAVLLAGLYLRRQGASAPPAEFAGLSLEEIEARADVEPENPWPQLELGARYAALGMDEAAVQRLERCLALAPETARAHLHLGEIELRRGNLAAAVERLERAVGLAPSLAEAYRELARAHYRLNNYRQALEAIERYVRLAPDDAEGHYVRGNLLGNEGKMPEAERCYARAAQLDPRRAASHLALGQCYLYSRPSSERLQQAERCFARALELEPAAADICYHLGLARFRQGRWREAAATLERALRLDAGYPRTHFALAQAYRRLGSPRAAQRHLARFEQLRRQTPSREAM